MKGSWENVPPPPPHPLVGAHLRHFWRIWNIRSLGAPKEGEKNIMEGEEGK